MAKAKVKPVFYRLKTKAKLIEEGWKEKGGGLWLGGDSRRPDFYLSNFTTETLLGTKVAVLDSQLNRDPPLFSVKINDYTGQLQWSVFDEKPSLMKPPPPTFKEYKSVHGSIKVFDDDDEVESDCRYKTMTKADAAKAAKWLLSVLE